MVSTAVFSTYCLYSAAVASSVLMYHLFEYKIDPIYSNIALIAPMIIVLSIPSSRVKVVMAAFSNLCYILGM